VLLSQSILVSFVTTKPQGNLAQTKIASEGRTTSDSPPQILLRVAVTDSKGRLIANLKQDAFTIIDRDAEQSISLFANEDVAASIVFLIDTSGSMKYGPTPAMIKQSIVRFIQQGRNDNEYLILSYADHAQLLVDWTRDLNQIAGALNSLAHAVPKGSTAAYDACDRAIESVRVRPNPKHVVILITDGEDNTSHDSFARVRESLKRSDVIVYAAFVFRDIESSFSGQRFLRDILSFSGGTGFPVNSGPTMNETFDFFARELRHQYLIGYRPNNSDAGWHPVKIMVRAIEILGLPKTNKPQKLSARTRQGYYGADLTR
jgi:Ca-activated chloride channel family protein